MLGSDMNAWVGAESPVESGGVDRETWVRAVFAKPAGRQVPALGSPSPRPGSGFHECADGHKGPDRLADIEIACQARVAHLAEGGRGPAHLEQLLLPRV